MKIVVAVAAVAIALAVMWMSGIGSGHSGVASAAPVEVDLAPLTARVAALEKQNTELLRKLDGSKLETPAASTREPAQQSAKQTAIDDLSSHVAKLEAELTDFRAKLDAQTRAGAGSALNQGKPDPTPASLDELTRRARDVAATEAQRLAALRELRGKTLPDGTDARLPVLDDMIRLAQNSTDAEARADV